MLFVRLNLLTKPMSTPALAATFSSAQISIRAYRYGSAGGIAHGLDGTRR